MTKLLKLQASKRDMLGGRVAAVLQHAVLGGVLKPGDRIVEIQVAKELGVSRAPVREALAALEEEGLVSRTNNGGAIVSILTRKDLDEIWTLRAALECLAVRQAMSKSVDQLVAQLEESIRVMEGVSACEEVAELDLQFHEILVRGANHSLLLDSWLKLRARIRLLMLRRNVTDDQCPANTVRAHREIMEAIRRGDEERAVQLVEKQSADQGAFFAPAFPEA